MLGFCLGHFRSFRISGVRRNFDHLHFFQLVHCTEVRFDSFLSGGFTTMAVTNPPEKKLAKSISVYCPVVPKRPKQKNSCSKMWLIDQLYIKLGYKVWKLKNNLVRRQSVKNENFIFSLSANFFKYVLTKVTVYLISVLYISVIPVRVRVSLTFSILKFNHNKSKVIFA